MTTHSVRGPRPFAHLVVVAPSAAGSGVGDHTDRMLEVLRPWVDQVTAVRTGAPGSDGLRDCIRVHRAVSRAIARDDRARTVLHVDLSGGAVAPFWSLVGRRGVTTTALVHEPPRPVWNPLRFRAVARHRYLDNALQWGLARPLESLERRVTRSTALTAATDAGVLGLAARRHGRRTDVVRLLPRAAVVVPPVCRRPLAVGLFGHLYRGKGFDLVDRLRERLDPGIGIVVAGRGTETLAPRPGVTVLGPVTGPDERRFFASIRLLLLPYRRKRVWGARMTPASGAFVDAVAHRTPCLALGSAGLRTLTGSGCETVDGVDRFAARAEALVDSWAGLEAMVGELERFEARQDVARTLDPLLAQWRR